MSVHVDEIHSDIVPARSAAGDARPAREPGHLAEEQEQWEAGRHRAALLARRTCAEGFDD